MRKKGILLGCLLGIVIAVMGQTKIDTKQLKANEPASRLFGYVSGIGMTFLDISGLTIDTTTNPPTLRAMAPPPAPVSVTRLDYTVPVATTTVVLSEIAGTRSVLVYRNGVLQRATADYTLNNLQLVFTSTLIVGDFVTVVMI